MEYLLQHFGKLIPVAVAMVLPASVVWLTLIVRRRRRLPLRRAFVTASLDVAIVMWGAWVSLLVTMPTTAQGSVHLVPGTDLLVAAGSREAFWQLTANFSLLLPLGMLLPARWAWWRSTRRVTIAAFATSCGIELTQYVAAIGRVTSTDDVLVNTTGAAAGASISLLIINRPRIPEFAPVVAPLGIRPGPRSPLWTIRSSCRSAPVAAVPHPRTHAATPGTAGIHRTRSTVAHGLDPARGRQASRV